MNEKNLTPKQQRLSKNYLIGLNATQAAIRAGFPHESALSALLVILVTAGGFARELAVVETWETMLSTASVS
jgi:hypothetical protein